MKIYRFISSNQVPTMKKAIRHRPGIESFQVVALD